MDNRRQRRNRARLIRAGIVLLIAAIATGTWFGARLGGRFVEATISERATDTLTLLNAGWAEVTVDGLTVTVTGAAPDADARDGAIAALAGMPYTTLVDETTVRPPPEPEKPPLAISLLGGPDGVILTGDVPEDQTMAGLVETLGQRFGRQRIDDQTTRGAAPADPPLSREIDVATEALDSLGTATVVLTPGAVSVTGTASSTFVRETISASLRDMAGSDVTVTLEISVPLPVLDAFGFAATATPNGIQITTCALRSETERERLAEVLEARGIAAPETCPSGLGGPRGDWIGLVDTALGALQTLDLARVAIVDGTVTLTPRRRMSEVDEARIRTTLALIVPLGTTVAIAAPDLVGSEDTPVPSTSRQAQTPWMRLNSSENGLRIDGTFEDAQRRTVLTTLAAAAFGADRVTTAFEDLPGPQPEGWQQAAVAAVDALAALRDGTIALEPGRLIATATQAHPDRVRSIHDRLTDTTPGYAISTRITVDITGSIADIPLPPRKCAALLNRTLGSAPVDFDFGSTRLSESTAPRITAIARAFERCGTGVVEVAGHTDDQGPESVNQRISQSRAEAVRAALVARGVPFDALAARGYGETRPIADNTTEEGRAKNRRIEFRVPE